MLSHMLLVAVLVFTVYSQLMVKSRAIIHSAGLGDTPNYLHYLFAMFTDLRVLSGLCATILAGICWMLAIERLEIGYAFPFMALTFVLVPVGSTAFFGESLPAPQFIGFGLIIAGVTVSALTR
jgi:drug/metabolite transporter (DMT)-like permease